MSRPLLKALCPRCHEVSLLDIPCFSQQGSAYSPLPDCPHCQGLLYLNDRYTLVERLGPRTFLALDWHSTPLQPCVVQREFPPRSSGEPILERLLSLSHQAQLPQVLGYFEHRGLGYLVQSYYSGTPLAQWISLGLPGSVVAIVVDTLLSLLAGIHTQGLLHGDVKPSNILVLSQEPKLWTPTELRLVDWGNAQEPSTLLPPWLTGNETHCPANAEYTAPEQLAGHPQFASDFYSIGVLGVQLLTGVAPFHWLDQADHWRVLYLGDREDVPADLCLKLDRLLHPDPRQRYSHPRLPPAFVPGSRPARLWQIARTLSGSQGHTAAVNALAHPPLTPSPWLASAGDDRTLRLWQWETGEMLTSVAVSPKAIQVLCVEPQSPQHLVSGHRLVSGGADGQLRCWEVTLDAGQRWQLSPSLALDRQHHGAINALCFIAPQTLAVAGQDKTISLWHLGDLLPLTTFKGHRLAINSLALNPIQPHLASGSSDATVKIWDLASGSLIATLKGHTAAIKTVAFSPNGDLLASAGNDRVIHLWDTHRWTLKQTLPGHGWPITHLQFTPEQTLWSSSWDHTLKCWNCAGPSPEHDRSPQGLDLRQSPEGLERFQSLTLPLTLPSEHTDTVTCFSFLSPKILVSGSADRTLKIWLG